MQRLFSLIAIALLGSAGLAAAAPPPPPDLFGQGPYRLGQGLHFPKRGLDVGGYLSLRYDGLRHRAPAFSVHDLSLFLNQRIGARWNLFSEMEVGDALAFSSNGHTRHDREFDIERLYADYRAGPAATLRVGKFLTPVGRWNLIHADPLVWTVSRPVTTEAPFARHATGAMLYGTVTAAGHDLDYWAFVDDSVALDPLHRDEPAFESSGPGPAYTNNFDRALGGRLLYHVAGDSLDLGVSWLHAHTSAPAREWSLLGLDLSWRARYLELSGEAIYRSSRKTSVDDERGGFLQAVVPLTHGFYFIARHERYRSGVLPAEARIDTLGLTYRPRPPLSLKLEYRSGRHNDAVAPDGWLGSLAILF